MTTMPEFAFVSLPPERIDLAAVEAIMLWPDEQSMRRRWIRAAVLDAGEAVVERLARPVLEEFARELIRDRDRLADLQLAAAERQSLGILVGLVTLEATVMANHDPSRAALGGVQERLCARLKGLKQIEPRTLNNKTGPYHRFRQVAHLWAAYSLASLDGDLTFPCRVADLPLFLATAEAFRQLAETSRAPKAPSWIMKPGDAVELPAALAAELPEVKLEIGPEVLPHPG